MFGCLGQKLASVVGLSRMSAVLMASRVDSIVRALHSTARATPVNQQCRENVDGWSELADQCEAVTEAWQAQLDAQSAEWM